MDIIDFFKIKRAFPYWFGYDIMPIDKRLLLLKQCGINGLSIYWTNEYVDKNGDFYDVAKKAITLGLKVDSLHCTFNFSYLIWEDSIKGEELYKSYLQAIDSAKTLNCNIVVIHTNGAVLNKLLGLKRLNLLNQYANNNEILLCVENLQIEDNLDIVLKGTDLSLCFDFGHDNIRCFKDFDLYNNRIRYLHIHDNHGVRDEHLPINWGNCLYDKIIKKLEYNSIEGMLLEMHYNPMYNGHLVANEYIKIANASIDALRINQGK